MQGLFAHRAGELVIDHGVDFLLEVIGDIDPREGVDRPFRRVGIILQTFLQEPDDRALRATDRAMEENHAPFGAVIPRGGLEDVHQMIQALVDAVDRIASVMLFVAEEAIARDLLLVLDILLGAIRQDHVVNPLERVPRHAWILLNQLEIILQGSFPIQFLILLGVLQVRDCAENAYSFCLVMHKLSPVSSTSGPAKRTSAVSPTSLGQKKDRKSARHPLPLRALPICKFSNF